MRTENVQVKICGITDKAALEACLAAGADFIGFVFYGPSPRALTGKEAAALLGDVTAQQKGQCRFVGLFVDASVAEIAEVLSLVPLNMIQLHGQESPAKVKDIKQVTGLPVIKALPVASKEDLEKAVPYEAVADWLLFDAKAETGKIAGGAGVPFDWSLLVGYDGAKPWMLAGGLDPINIGTALKLLKPAAVDVSSGVEEQGSGKRGQKSPAKISDFIEAVRKSG